jgi:hypothetical protein
MRTRLRHVLLPALLSAAGLLVATGCGQKIAIPEAKGLFSVKSYVLWDSFLVDDPRQVAVQEGVIYLLEGNTLARRNLDFGALASQPGLDDPTALCVDEELVFVWEEGAQQLSWFLAESLLRLGSRHLPGNGRVTAMATCAAGIDQVPGALTFLYLAVPDSGVVRRFAFEQYSGASPYGILTRSDGLGARFVHRAAGMAVDYEDSLLVCDAGPDRHWVIRFNAEPDVTDLATAPGEPDPLRGRAALFRPQFCNPPAADEYALGNAPTCDQTDWVPGPSDLPGFFDEPLAVTVDGSGRIFVADTGNGRIQVFLPDGIFDEFVFGGPRETPRPVSLAVYDYKKGIGETNFHYAAWVFVVEPDLGRVQKFASSEHATYLSQQLPPKD